MPESDQKTLLSKDINQIQNALSSIVKQQEQEIKNAEDLNIAYVSNSGEKYYKNDDSRLVEQVKRNDQFEKEVNELKYNNTRFKLKNHAEESLAHLSGDVETKADLLEAIAVLDPVKSAKVLEMVKAKHSSIANSGPIGVSNSEDVSNTTSANSEFYQEVERVKNSKGISSREAFNEVRMKQPNLHESIFNTLNK